MERTRTHNLLILVFIAVALFILMQENVLGSSHVRGIGVGVLVLLLAVWEAIRGKSSLMFRTVKKSEAPGLFWVAVFLTAFVGIACVALSFVP